MTMTKYTKADIAAHSTASSLWIVIDNGVYDVTKYLSDHPGGAQALLRNGGKDASKMFALTHGVAAREKLATFKIGETAPETAIGASVSGATKVTATSSSTPSEQDPRLLPSKVLLCKSEKEGKSSTIRICNPDPQLFDENTFPAFGHVSIKFKDDASKTEVLGLYSPCAITKEYVEIIVKPAGPKSQLICALPSQKEIWMSTPLTPHVSPDRSSFLCIRPVHVAFIAAGSGVTPFFRPLRQMLTTNPLNVPTVTFIVCQRNATFQVGASVLRELEDQATAKRANAPNVHVHRHYTQENARSHRIGKNDLLGYGAAFMTQVYICGPHGFNQHIATLFTELGFLPTSIQIIQ